ncbi:MAG: 50S ribosomal protein L24 [Candidatus Margulisiibacteriota bacterium]|jgi:large subunit ribosomal protein L24
MQKFKKDDLVEVISGSEKGKKGKILEILKVKGTVRVEGVKKGKKHVKRTQEKAGGIIELNLPIHGSNIQLVCKKCNAKAKIAYVLLKDNKKVRQCKKCKEVI